MNIVLSRQVQSKMYFKCFVGTKDVECPKYFAILTMCFETENLNGHIAHISVKIHSLGMNLSDSPKKGEGLYFSRVVITCALLRCLSQGLRNLTVSDTEVG